MLGPLAALATRRPGRIVATALGIAAVSIALGASTIDELYPYSAADPDSDSSRASERVHRAIGIDPDASLVALVETRAPVRSRAGQAQVDRIAKRIFLARDVALVTTYFTSGDQGLISRDGHATVVVVNFATLSDREQQRATERIEEKFAGDERVSFGGETPGNLDVKEIVSDDIARAELLAFPLLLLLSFWFFRGLVAALLPLLVGGLAITTSLAVLRAVNAVVPISVFALNLVLGLALALAVDYSLLIVSRYREEVARSGPGPGALRRTLATAGRTVMFSSIAVAVALTALLVFPQRFLYSMGVGGALVAILSGAAALVVLPAALALLGERVDAIAPRRLQRAAARDARPAKAGGWYRLSRLVMRRPGRIAVSCAVLLVVLGLPFLHVRFIAVDSSVLPAGTESRQVRETLTRRFPPNLTLPLFVVLDSPKDAATRELARRIRDLAGAARVDPPRAVDDRTTLISVAPEASPLAGQSEHLVRDIRSLGAPFEVLVGGRAAEYVDQKESISAHLPAALVLLFGTALVVVFLMTGSLVLPLKAVLMNVLTLSAAFGALVFVFQEGRLESLLDYSSPGALELSQPLVLLAVGFGIATDYGVFLLSRIKEAHDAGAPNSEAVSLGLERTGRVVTAAALLICVAIGAFATSRIVFIKELGIGIALAVLIDATIVRALLVPSLMALLGRWNWWAPRPLRRLHRRIVRAA